MEEPELELLNDDAIKLGEYLKELYKQLNRNDPLYGLSVISDPEKYWDAYAYAEEKSSVWLDFDEDVDFRIYSIGKEHENKMDKHIDRLLLKQIKEVENLIIDANKNSLDEYEQMNILDDHCDKYLTRKEVITMIDKMKIRKLNYNSMKYNKVKGIWGYAADRIEELGYIIGQLSRDQIIIRKK